MAAAAARRSNRATRTADGTVRSIIQGGGGGGWQVPARLVFRKTRRNEFSIFMLPSIIHLTSPGYGTRFLSPVHDTYPSTSTACLAGQRSIAAKSEYVFIIQEDSCR